mgnify:FL=1
MPQMPESMKKSGAWLITERVLRLLNGLIIYAAIARHLGANDFGLLNIAIGIASIFSAFSGMGADSYNLSEIKKNYHQKESFIGSAILIRAAFSILSISALLITSLIYPEIRGLLIILTPLIIVSALSIFQHNLLAEGHFSTFAKLSCTSIFISFTIRAIGIATNQKLSFFAYTAIIEGIILALLCIKHSNGLSYLALCLKKWKFENLKKYYKDCLPTAVSALLISVYFKLEVLLIAKWIGADASGKWAVLTLVLTPWSMISAALLPIFNNQLASMDPLSEIYKKSLSKVILKFSALALFAVLVNTLFSFFVLDKILNEEYSDIFEIIPIASLAILPMFLGGLQEISIAHRRTTKIALVKVIIGIPFSVLLLYFMIQWLGLLGAGISIVISYSFTAVALNYYTDKYFLRVTLSSLRWTTPNAR